MASALPPGKRLAEILTVTDQTDEHGRLLLEDAAPQEARRRARRAGVAMDTERCPYRDTPSRYDGLMNASAYEALRHDTADILDGFAWLSGQYHEHHPSRRATAQGLVDVSYLGLTFPLVLFYRAQDPVPSHGELPSFIASIFKASRGVFSASVDLLNSLDAQSTNVTAHEVTVFADEKRHLRRPQTQRVCAAPTRLIESVLGVILTGSGADAGKSQLSALVDFPGLWGFFNVQTELSAQLSNYSYLLNTLMARGDVAGPQQLFKTVVPDGGRRRSFGEITETALRRVNKAQADLNRHLGRADHAKRITFEDLLHIL